MDGDHQAEAFTLVWNLVHQMEIETEICLGNHNFPVPFHELHNSDFLFEKGQLLTNAYSPSSTESP